MRTDDISMVPTKAIRDIETLKATNHIYGDHSLQNYYSDNAKPLRNAAIMAGLTPEQLQPGVSQTNAYAETTTKTVPTSMLVATRWSMFLLSQKRVIG